MTSAAAASLAAVHSKVRPGGPSETCLAQYVLTAILSYRRHGRRIKPKRRLPVDCDDGRTGAVPASVPLKAAAFRDVWLHFGMSGCISGWLWTAELFSLNEDMWTRRPTGPAVIISAPAGRSHCAAEHGVYIRGGKRLGPVSCLRATDARSQN